MSDSIETEPEWDPNSIAMETAAVGLFWILVQLTVCLSRICVWADSCLGRISVSVGFVSGQANPVWARKRPEPNPA